MCNKVQLQVLASEATHRYIYIFFSVIVTLVVFHYRIKLTHYLIWGTLSVFAELSLEPQNDCVTDCRTGLQFVGDCWFKFERERESQRETRESERDSIINKCESRDCGFKSQVIRFCFVLGFKDLRLHNILEKLE